MLGRLLLLFIIVPMVELFLLIELGQVIGTWPTLGIIIVTGFVGAYLVRRQGIQALNRIQTDVQQGQLPADSIGDGVMILVAGAFLMTPGILTDITGFLCLIPATRKVIKRIVWGQIRKSVEGGVMISFNGQQPFGGAGDSRHEPDNVIVMDHQDD